MSILPINLQKTSVQRVLNFISPYAKLLDVSPIPGGYSNHTHLIVADGPDGVELKFVVRQYLSHEGDRGDKAVREFEILKLVRNYSIPAPEPLLLDDSGEILGIPGIVTSFIEGQSELRPSNPEERAVMLAAILAKLHSIPLEISKAKFLLDANSEATWFQRDSNAERIMSSHALGHDLLNASRNLNAAKVTPSIVHTDIWPGNIIWENGHISGIVDWDDTGFGDPVLDIGYATMELSLAGYFDAAEILSLEYAKLIGKELQNLQFWQMAAAVKPIYKPKIWDVLEEPRKGNLNRFIKSIL